MADHGFDVWDEAGVFVARLWYAPKFEAHAGSTLLELFQTHIDDSGRPEVVFDLNGASQLNPELLSNLIRLYKPVRNNSGRVVTCNVDPNIQEFFRTCGFTKVFHFAKDLPTALEFLRNPEVDPPGSWPIPSLR